MKIKKIFFDEKLYFSNDKMIKHNFLFLIKSNKFLKSCSTQGNIKKSQTNREEYTREKKNQNYIAEE